jgi:hypothetical protein
MAKPRKQWGQLSRAARERAAREAAKDYGLSRRQARERYNRGTYRPFSRDPVKRIPESAPRYPVSVGRDLKEAAIKNMDTKLGDYFSYNRFTILDAIEHHASTEALQRLAGASEDELTTWAAAQTRRSKNTPQWLRTLGWTDDRGKWHNIFWYH